MKESRAPRWIRELSRYLPMKSLFLLYGNIYDVLAYRHQEEGRESWSYYPLGSLLYCFFKDQKYSLVGFYDQVDGMTFKTDEERKLFQAIDRGKATRIETEGEKQDDEPAEAREPGDGGMAPGRADRPPGGQEQERERAEAERGRTHRGRGKPYLQDFDTALSGIRRVLSNREYPAAVVIDFSSRLVTGPVHLQSKERLQFIKIAKSTREAARVRLEGEDTTVNNVLVMICDKLNDLPAWLYFDNPLAKSIQIDTPDRDERKLYFDIMAGDFAEADGAEEYDGKNISDLVELTHGFKNYELEGLRILSVRERVRDPRKLVDLYRYGESGNAWDQLSEEKMSRASEILKRRVKGQDAAVEAVVDIVKRSAVGLSGTQHSGASHKPRGVLFFAGPTGVGKTELAKALAELLFGRDEACIRFDMSEYSQEHSDQKLLGAPPGYVGYEEGGQLTNRIKESPFSILLFDEIEKAHPNILDKFLQILEDGRMTDGRGETVYFSESVIIFTSNIGAYEDVRDPAGFVTRKPNILPYSWFCPSCGSLRVEEEARVCSCGGKPERVPTPYSLVRAKILGAIEEHFKFTLGRPEIYNRMGNNFVVFDYIREDIIEQIVDKILASVARELAEDEERNNTLVFSPRVRSFLIEKAARNLEMGGRGIGNLVETVLINPLARRIFDEKLSGARIEVESIVEEPGEEFPRYSVEIALSGARLP